MDFARLPLSELNSVDFTLPAPVMPLKGLPGTPDANFDFRLGAPRWGTKAWVGTLYPETTKEADFMNEYVKQLNFIELGATFYHIPTPQLIAEWAEKAAGKDFLFSPKISRQITQIRKLKGAEVETGQFLMAVAILKSQLGTSLLQLADKFSTRDQNRLISYLESLPREFKVAVELRDPSWFQDRQILKDTFQAFEELGAGTVLTDSPGRRDILHMYLTTPEAFIRFNCNENHPTDRIRLESWKEQIQHWKSEGIKRVYFTLHQTEAFPEVLPVAREVFAEWL